jgi:uncharacterized protein (TIGR03086 family)
MSEQHSDTVAQYRRALDGFEATLARVPAEAWENQSPCDEWKARDVVGHVVGVQHYLATMASGAELPATRPATRPASPRELLGDDPVGAFAAAKQHVLDVLAVPENRSRTVTTPFGEMPAEVFTGVLVLDALTHTWDLARAAGLDVTLDPELVSVCFERVRPMDQAIRRPGAFADKVTPPEGADEQTELMAFLGRKVG